MTKVGLVQINSRFSGQVYLPLSAGALQAYAQKHLKNDTEHEFLPPIYSRVSIEEGVQSLMEADVAGFSTYVWNFQLSLKIAAELKRRKPEVLIVFGGPHVPDRAEEYLNQYPFIDIACHGEGEKVFLAILENASTDGWSQIPSISYLDPDGRLVQNPRVPRMKDLSQAPSPYLDDVFRPLMSSHPEENWISIWETNRGCPFSCTFCDWGSAVASKVNKWELERLYAEIEWFGRHQIGYVFCADANFGILPRDIDIAKYCAEIKQQYGYPEAISIQSTKNAQERSYQAQKILADAGLNKVVVISMQSLNPATLEAIKRGNISLEVFKENQRRFAAEGIETMTDLIPGMPEETYDSFTDGISTLIENGQHNRIQFNNLSVLPNAEMGDPEQIKQYGMEIVETQIVNIHGKIDDPENTVPELQQLVVGTHSMPKEEWVRTRAFGWMIGLLHFNKILQIPLMVLHEEYGLSYRELVEFFLEGRFDALSSSEKAGPSFPVLSEVRSFFFERAQDIQKGSEEYFHSAEWLNIYWSAEEYILIKLCVENKLDAFYDEVGRAIPLLLQERSLSFSPAVIGDAITLNRSLIKLPFLTEDLKLELSCNVLEFYHSVLVGDPIAIEEKPCAHSIDRTAESWESWEEWYEKVVWYGNRKGAYLYGNVSTDKQLEGHY